MICAEARQLYAALISGELGISETALIEAHLSRCDDCRQIVEGLYQAAPRNPEGRIVPAGDLGIRAESRVFLPLLVLVALGASALVVAPGLAPYTWHRVTALVVAARHVTSQLATRTAPPPEPNQIKPPSEAPAIGKPDAIPPSRPSSSSLPQAPTSPSLPSRTESEQTTAAVPTEPTDKEAERASAPPALSAPAPSPRRASTQKPAESAAPASPRNTERRQARQGERAGLVDSEPAVPHLISPVKASETDVVMQISVRDRGMAERDINLLLTRLGGTNIGQAEGAAIIAVVPQSSYGEFTRGLAQIGSWNLEASRSSLPDPVHVAVRLAK
jgi:hypothetical protein